ncbi:hypothetical protein HID58_018526 [Brassica napus]|uniref:16S rRNA (uracil(1498)-N(3))-methyltransferase n=1 Tax=Brassica napus TaxID=3708 RepID=A0ABQ8DA39_BRANA|nr:hypothetical protein HID58_018526 [Brassica napus]
MIFHHARHAFSLSHIVIVICESVHDDTKLLSFVQINSDKRVEWFVFNALTEFWHMAKVLRLKAEDRLKNYTHFCTYTLKSGRADWLIEQCTLFAVTGQRLHQMVLVNHPIKFNGSWVIFNTGNGADFTRKEVELMLQAGDITVGLGSHRLQAETETIALLATLVMWSDSQETTA